MAVASIPVKQLDSITECPICVDTLTDDRVLPCMHTFCLRCIEKWANDKQPEDITCPICRKGVSIPEGGLAQLPRNIFLDKLLEAKKLSTTLSHGGLLCDVCCDESQATTNKKKAEIYCVECRTNMCDQCYAFHQKFRLQAVHKVIRISRELNTDELLQKFPEDTCDQHSGENLKIYCFDCSTTVCVMCYIGSHNSHKCSDVKEVAKNLSSGMTSDVVGVAVKIDDCHKLMDKITGDEKKFVEHVKETKKAIYERAEKMKQLVDEHTMNQVDELESSEKKQLKQAMVVKEEIERQVTILESFIRYSKELISKGTPSDITKAAGGLHKRAEELLAFEVQTDLEVDRTRTQVQFASSLTDDDLKRVFGELDISVRNEGDFMAPTKLAHTIPSTGQSVTGIASLDNELYVVRWGVAQVSVYDISSSYTHLRNISIPNFATAQPRRAPLVEPRGLASCATSRCLYVSSQNNNHIHKVPLAPNEAGTRWAVGVSPYGLSVNNAHNVLVACYNAHKLQEYSTVGALVREINLQPDITNPLHVFQFPDGNYGVIHQGNSHRFCLVEPDGRVIKSFGSTAGSGPEQLYAPYGLAVSKRGGTILVADKSNSRIFMLNGQSLSGEPLPNSVFSDKSLNNPYCLHIDASCRRIYIGEWDGCRVFCCTSDDS